MVYRRICAKKDMLSFVHYQEGQKFGPVKFFPGNEHVNTFKFI